jgi:hypothetical protein
MEKCHYKKRKFFLQHFFDVSELLARHKHFLRDFFDDFCVSKKSILTF